MSSHKPKQLHLFCATEDTQGNKNATHYLQNGANCHKGHLRSIGGNPNAARYVPPNPIIEQVAVARWVVHDAVEEKRRGGLTKEVRDKILSDLAHILKGVEELAVNPEIEEL